MNFRSSRLNFFNEFEEIFVEMIDGFPFGFGRSLPRGLPILKCGFRFIANDFVFSKRGLNDLAMSQIVSKSRRLLLELFGEFFHDCASTSAKWIVLTLLPWRDSRPWTCIKPLESFETIYSAPVSN